jgi:Tfp pilus assembly protein PilV
MGNHLGAAASRARAFEISELYSAKAKARPQMLRIGTFPSSTGGASRVRLVRKRAHCAAQASLTEVIVAVTILTIVVWGMVGFLMNGRVLVERTGQGVIAAQVAQQQLDQARSLPYASVASSRGTETVNGLLYSWVLTVTTAQADPADGNSTFKQTGVTVTWPTAPNANAGLYTAMAVETQ